MMKQNHQHSNQLNQDKVLKLHLDLDHYLVILLWILLLWENVVKQPPQQRPILKLQLKTKNSETLINKKLFSRVAILKQLLGLHTHH